MTTNEKGNSGVQLDMHNSNRVPQYETDLIKINWIKFGGKSFSFFIHHGGCIGNSGHVWIVMTTNKHVVRSRLNLEIGTGKWNKG